MESEVCHLILQSSSPHLLTQSSIYTPHLTGLYLNVLIIRQSLRQCIILTHIKHKSEINKPAKKRTEMCRFIVYIQCSIDITQFPHQMIRLCSLIVSFSTPWRAFCKLANIKTWPSFWARTNHSLQLPGLFTTNKSAHLLWGCWSEVSATCLYRCKLVIMLMYEYRSHYNENTDKSRETFAAMSHELPCRML